MQATAENTLRSPRVGKRAPGRPRSEQAQEAILTSTVEMLEIVGFQDLSVEAVANRANVSKATVYRWWPSKASLVADAFASSVVAELSFPDTGSVVAHLSLQMYRLIKIFKGRRGKVVSALIGGGQSDPELIDSFLQRFLRPRREEAHRILLRAIERGELNADIDLDLVLDALYGPIYMRFLLGHGTLSRAFANELCDLVLKPLLVKRTR